MLVDVEVTEEEIAYAEEILLPSGGTFDGERRNFIRCLRTSDLQAVPGSGKTTALLAKLLILERHLPFADGSGILVISHTNAAVDEIKNRIGKHCARLFAYPSFVGTIQSFVDEFLAIPGFVHCMKFRPSRIDAESYDAEIERYYSNMPTNRAKAWLDNRSDPIHFLKDLRFDVDLNLTEGIGGDVALKSDCGTASYTTLANMKKRVFNRGLLHFEDAFLFADLLLSKFPRARDLLRARFRIVLVDEMQDMSKHQHDLLEQLFFDGVGDDGAIMQRIGDKNQAIFGGKDMAVEGVWRDRNESLTFNNSQRLSALNAVVLAPFALYRSDTFAINGLYGANVKPHVFVYDDDTMVCVVRRFAELIKQLYELGRIPLEGGCPKLS